MKKEEFPTFLNEQPTVVFGRTTRELLIIAVGLASGYLCWQHINLDNVFLAVILRVICITLCVGLAVIVAFVKVSTRPLEEWAIVGFSYLVLPKVYLYIPPEEERGGEVEEEQADGWSLETFTNDEEDRYS
jgi:hypothetical protein